MRSALLVVPFLLTLAAFAQHPMQDPQCRGVIKGVAIGQDGQPARGLELVVFPAQWRDFDYIFPTTKTNDAGEYRFDVHLCPGRYAVFPDDEKAGYPIAFLALYKVLYDTRYLAEVLLSVDRPEVELRVNLPPKPGLLQVQVLNRDTKAAIPKARLQWKPAGKTKQPWVEREGGLIEAIPVPPGKNVLLHVTADGFREWKESKGRGRLIHLAAGSQMTLEVELEPRQR